MSKLARGIFTLAVYYWPWERCWPTLISRRIVPGVTGTCDGVAVADTGPPQRPFVLGDCSEIDSATSTAPEAGTLGLIGLWAGAADVRG
jgi:hypothetical protein